MEKDKKTLEIFMRGGKIIIFRPETGEELILSRNEWKKEKPRLLEAGFWWGEII